jgi:HEAT repeat protein
MQVLAHHSSLRRSGQVRNGPIAAIAALMASLAVVAIVVRRSHKTRSPAPAARTVDLASQPASRTGGSEVIPSEPSPGSAQPVDSGRALESARTPTAGGSKRDLEAMTRRIVQLGPSAIPVVVGILCGEIDDPEFVAGEPDGSAHAVAIEHQQQILMESLRRFRASDVLPVLREKGSGQANLDTRLVVANLLGKMGSAQAFDVLIEVVSGIEPIHLMRSYVQGTLEDAVTACLKSDPKTYGKLANLQRTAPASLWPLLIRSLGRTRNRQSAESLVWFLGRSSELDPLVIEELGQVTEGSGISLSETALGSIRPLLDHPTIQVQRSAAVVLGKLGDRASFEALAKRVNTGDRTVAAAALWSLKIMTRADLGHNPQAWLAWRDLEETWWREDAPSLLSDLHSEDSGQVFDAISALMQRPFFKHDIAQAIGPLATAGDLAVALSAVNALERIGSSLAIPWLVQALTLDDSRRAPVRSALHALTGLDLPGEYAVWSSVLPVEVARQ